MRRFLQCLVGQHKVDRRRVWDDSVTMRGTCLGCGAAMLRDIDGWRLFAPSDDSAMRLPHPRVDGTPRPNQ